MINNNDLTQWCDTSSEGHPERQEGEQKTGKEFIIIILDETV